MRPELLEYVSCPACGGDLYGSVQAWDGDDAMSGRLHCVRCRAAYPILRGVPRLSLGGGEHEPDSDRDEVDEPVDDDEWSCFLEALELDDDELSGKVVLDAARSRGRLAKEIAERGAEVVIGVDGGAGSERAFRSTRHLANVHVVEADVRQLPFRRRVFDIVWSSDDVRDQEAALLLSSLGDAVTSGGKVHVLDRAALRPTG